VAKVLLENFGIKSGLMTTVHSYTGDQRLLDFPHKDLRRARAAALSMIPTTTGAAKAVALVLPELSGKLNGLAIRVPTPNVSIVDLVVTVDKPVSRSARSMRRSSWPPKDRCRASWATATCRWSPPTYNGCPLSSIFDAQTTYVLDDMVKVLSWYDNEVGYSNRMVDLMAMMGEQL
jgi:glyceraldehyde 3-phosphate dehydrogenase